MSAAGIKTMSLDELTEALKTAECVPSLLLPQIWASVDSSMRRGKDKIMIQKRLDKLNKEAGGAQAAIASLQKLLDSEKVGDAIKEMNAMSKELEKQTKSKKTDEAPLKKQVAECQKMMEAVVLYSNNL